MYNAMTTPIHATPNPIEAKVRPLAQALLDLAPSVSPARNWLLALTAAMMAQIPVGKKQQRVTITAGTVQSRSGGVTITGAGWNPPAVTTVTLDEL